MDSRNATIPLSGTPLQEAAHLARITMISGLTSSFAHELNQPLTAVLSNAQAAIRIASERSPDMGEIRDALHEIAIGVSRMGKLIRHMHGMLKNRTTARIECSLNDIITDVIRVVTSDAIIQQVTLRLQLDPRSPTVMGDRVQLEQVVLNLVMNAIESFPSLTSAQVATSGDRCVVIKTAIEDTHYTRVTVCDTGVGIDPLALQRVFEPFFTTKHNGLGVGLPISQSIAQSHGGSLSAEHNTPAGAAFHLTLPLRRTGHS